jgi:hypothetical protein
MIAVLVERAAREASGCYLRGACFGVVAQHLQHSIGAASEVCNHRAFIIVTSMNIATGWGQLDVPFIPIIVWMWGSLKK